MAKNILPIAITQMACTADTKANLKKQVALVERAAKGGAKVICTQEMFKTQYFCQIEDHRFFKTAEPIPGESTDALGKIAKKYKCTIIASLFERRAQGLYHNTAAVLGTDGGVQGVYRKMHIPDDPLFYEKFYFTPGDAPIPGAAPGTSESQAGFRSFKTPYADIGVLICWDQWYPEAARATALTGAQVLFYPTAIGWHPSEKAQYGKAQHESWELIQRSHAVANGCYVAAPNRIGHELILDENGKPVNKDGLEFWGQSFITSPNGQIIAKASVDKEEILTADLDLDQVEFSRTHWPFLRDRRIDAYTSLTRRYVGSST